MTEKDGKYIFKSVKVGEKGLIVIPKEARKIFKIEPGDNLIVLGVIGYAIVIFLIAIILFKKKIRR